MRRILIAFSLALLLLHSAPAKAGFLLGYALGSVSPGESSKPVTGQPLAISSTNHDVITCLSGSFYGHPGRCKETLTYVTSTGSRNSILWPTPAQWAAHAGYTTIHKVGAVITAGGSEFIIMEVSK